MRISSSSSSSSRLSLRLQHPVRSRKRRAPVKQHRCYPTLQYFCLLLAFCFSVRAQMEDYGGGDEYVRQVLQDEAQHYHQDDESYYKAREEDRLQREARALVEEELLEQERAEQIRLQREDEFEAELMRMNEEQRKAAKRQKRKDGRVVRKILKAAKKGRYYAVLGIRNWDVHVGRFTLVRADTKAIRRAYRSRALAVHPDKNRDGRAQEAFMAVENAAAILSDERDRELYDEQLRLARQERRNEMKQTATMMTDVIASGVQRIVWVFKRVLGPFAMPILILGFLLA